MSAGLGTCLLQALKLQGFSTPIREQVLDSEGLCQAHRALSSLIPARHGDGEVCHSQLSKIVFWYPVGNVGAIWP